MPGRTLEGHFRDAVPAQVVDATLQHFSEEGDVDKGATKDEEATARIHERSPQPEEHAFWTSSPELRWIINS